MPDRDNSAAVFTNSGMQLRHRIQHRIGVSKHPVCYPVDLLRVHDQIVPRPLGHWYKNKPCKSMAANSVKQQPSNSTTIKPQWTWNIPSGISSQICTSCWRAMLSGSSSSVIVNACKQYCVLTSSRFTPHAAGSVHLEALIDEPRPAVPAKPSRCSAAKAEGAACLPLAS